MSGATPLETAIAGAGPGATVTVNPGTCTTPATGYSVTSNHPITLQGSPGGTTIDGANLTGTNRTLTVSNGGTWVIRDLTFVNGDQGADGGAVQLGGDTSTTLQRLQFYANEGDHGGALYVLTNPATSTVVEDSTFGSAASGQGNLAASGGAIYADSAGSLQIVRSSFIGNRASAEAGGALLVQAFGFTLASSLFSGNTALIAGGAANFVDFGGTSTVTVTGNAFTANQVSDPAPSSPGITHLGGALVLDTDRAITQSGNVFDRNAITFGTSTGESLGGGEWVGGGPFTSRNDRFTNNQAAVPGDEAEGAGLALEGCDSVHPGAFRAENLVAAGNSFTGAGTGARNGAGVYVGCGNGPATLTLLDSTVAANSSGGGTAGLFGGPDDTLVMQNSIAAGNSGGADLTGFASKTVTFSDACPLLGGAGNLCANPLLVNPGAGDVHETAGSPTLDKGSTALVPAGLTTDYEGNPRIQGAAVDIGADENVFASADRTAPGVTGASIGKAFAVAKRATAITARKKKRKRAKRGTTIRFTLSEAATVRLRIDRKLKGRRVKKGKKRVCAKPNRKNRKKRKCTRYKRAGKTLVRSSKAGKNKVKFSGRIAKKALKRGAYRLTIVATDASGNKSKAKRLKFKIVKP
jgi:hypothetical protein